MEHAISDIIAELKKKLVGPGALRGEQRNKRSDQVGRKEELTA